MNTKRQLDLARDLMRLATGDLRAAREFLAIANQPHNKHWRGEALRAVNARRKNLARRIRQCELALILHQRHKLSLLDAQN